MPVYEYRCEQCGAVTDFLVQRMGASPDDPKCEKCGGTSLQRVTSSISVGKSQPERPCASPSSCPTGNCPFA